MSPELIAASIFFGCLALMILGGNSLVICAFGFGSRRMKTCTNYFIVNLAIADWLVGFWSVPYWIYIQTLPPKTETRDIPSYIAFQAMDVLFGSLSIMNLVVLTFERLLAVAYPTFHFNLTKKQIGCALSLTWILSVILAGLGFLAPTQIPRSAYLYMIFTFVFALPTVIIIGCYIVIFQVAKDSATMASRRVKKDLKIARMILIIIGLFLICWLPFFTLSIVYYNCHTWCNDIPNAITKIVKAFHYSNSMMNFWVYAVRSPDYRRSFSALIRWRLPRFRSDTMTSYRLRQRTMSNPTSSLESEKRKGTLVNNETMCTPLPDRSHPPAANGVTYTSEM